MFAFSRTKPHLGLRSWNLLHLQTSHSAMSGIVPTKAFGTITLGHQPLGSWHPPASSQFRCIGRTRRTKCLHSSGQNPHLGLRSWDLLHLQTSHVGHSPDRICRHNNTGTAAAWVLAPSCFITVSMHRIETWSQDLLGSPDGAPPGTEEPELAAASGLPQAPGPRPQPTHSTEPLANASACATLLATPCAVDDLGQNVDAFRHRKLQPIFEPPRFPTCAISAPAPSCSTHLREV